MSDSSESYIVEAGGAIPSWVSEAESVDNQDRPINPKIEQQPQQFENIINPVQKSQQQQEQIAPSNIQARRGIVKKEGKGNRNKNTQSQQNQEQPFKREIIDNEQKPIQDQQQPTRPKNQFFQQSQVYPKQQQERKNQIQQQDPQPKKIQKAKAQDQPPQQQLQKSDESNNQEQRQQKQISPQPFQQEIQQEIKQTLTNDYQNQRNQIQQQQKPASSASPENKDKKLNILKQIRKMQGISKLLIRKVPFMRMVRRTAQNICDENKLDTPRFTYESIQALQSLMEKTMVSIFEDANMITSNSNRVTLFGKDLNVLRRLKNAPWDYI